MVETPEYDLTVFEAHYGKLSDALNPRGRSCTPRQATCDLRKLRGKQLIERIGSSHRYRRPAKGFAP
jgi:hypothetical protein